jgi:hypothetical protein
MRNLKILKFQKSEILKTYQYYSGNFPCTRYNCLGCPHQLIAGQTFIKIFNFWPKSGVITAGDQQSGVGRAMLKFDRDV